MREIASQLARRAQPSYVKDRAKAMAVQKSVEIRDRVAASPLALGILGGLATAGIARILLGRRHRPDPYESYHEVAQYDVPPSESDDDDEATSPGLRDRAMAKIDHLRDRIPSGRQIARTARRMSGHASEYAGDQPAITAVGALAVGVALGFLVPLSNRERKLLAPVRAEVSDRLNMLGSDVGERMQDEVDALEDKIRGEGEDEMR